MPLLACGAEASMKEFIGTCVIFFCCMPEGICWSKQHLLCQCSGFWKFTAVSSVLPIVVMTLRLLHICSTTTSLTVTPVEVSNVLADKMTLTWMMYAWDLKPTFRSSVWCGNCSWAGNHRAPHAFHNCCCFPTPLW